MSVNKPVYDGCGEVITIFYDGSCPSCVRDRYRYQKWLAKKVQNVEWFDITDQHQSLQNLGIDPHRALVELHIRTADGTVVSELPAYIILLSQVWWLRPLAWIIGLPGIRLLLSKWYRSAVRNRLNREGRYPDHM